MAGIFWRRRKTISAYFAWQAWLAVMCVVSLPAVATVHITGAYPEINLDEGGLLFLYVGIGLGGPLLMLDTYARHKSDGSRGIFGAIFDLIASLFG